MVEVFFFAFFTYESGEVGYGWKVKDNVKICMANSEANPTLPL